MDKLPNDRKHADLLKREPFERGATDPQIASIFRAAEINRRELRRAYLENEAKLAGEAPPPPAVEAQAREAWAAQRIVEAKAVSWKSGYNSAEIDVKARWAIQSLWSRLLHAFRATLP